MKKRVILAYSGGLDTSVIVRWLTDRGFEVITYTADVGQGEELDEIPEKAKQSGATEAIVEDVKEEFARDYCMPLLQSGALYEGKYTLLSALSRPLISKKLVDLAHEYDAHYVAHGSTGKGNDQVRFEVSAWALDPDIEVLAPVREWEFKSRDEEIEYAKKHGIPVKATKEKPYSYDRNLWGVAIEAGPLEDPWTEPPEDAFEITVSPEKAPDKPEYIEIEFENGIPVAINESPAAVLLMKAYDDLESFVLDRFTYHYKLTHISQPYADLVYEGLWFSKLREAFDAFNSEIAQLVNGTVKIKLYKGNFQIVGRKSPNSLYIETLATYSPKDEFDQKAGGAFTKIWGLPLKVFARVNKKKYIP